MFFQKDNNVIATAATTTTTTSTLQCKFRDSALNYAGFEISQRLL
jgi:hypothetical protein